MHVHAHLKHRSVKIQNYMFRHACVWIRLQLHFLLCKIL
jgi:hypothetical protein